MEACDGTVTYSHAQSRVRRTHQLPTGCSPRSQARFKESGGRAETVL
jgi:hypothetical protein